VGGFFGQFGTPDCFFTIPLYLNSLNPTFNPPLNRLIRDRASNATARGCKRRRGLQDLGVERPVSNSSVPASNPGWASRLLELGTSQACGQTLGRPIRPAFLQRGLNEVGTYRSIICMATTVRGGPSFHAQRAPVRRRPPGAGAEAGSLLKFGNHGVTRRDCGLTARPKFGDLID
jgi:hypothetical protein